ncbi:uncharacterized protein PRCAT00000449001 [Priceomyces carsonii]|uniref:uncharacterized protein n=1 Tax=Priceomyces carsonii TaxID=28549 RepID=UPI002EDAC3B8|nr:unnamed protein product [Priceomyces carsonii]
MFGKDNSPEEFELDAHFQDQEHDLRRSEDSLDSRLSNASEFSLVFEELEEGAKVVDSENIDLFINNPIFQIALRIYGDNKKSRKWLLSFGCGLVAFIWLVGLVFYSRLLVNTSERIWEGHINIGGKDIKLNSFSLKFQNVTMESYREGAYYTSNLPITWLDESQYPKHRKGEGYYLSRNVNDSFVIKDIKNKENRVLIEDLQFRFRKAVYYAQELKLNPRKPFDDRSTFHIVISDLSDKWRHLTLGHYWLFNSNTSEYASIQPPLDLDDLKDETSVKPLQKLHFAEFSPTGDEIIFGYKHNLYIQILSTGEIIPVTDDGGPDIFNGKPDWVYEEEVAANDKLFWWSPDEDNLIYAKIDDTGVARYDINYYMDHSDEVLRSSESNSVLQYPEKMSLRYPKPGTNNPKLTLHNFKFSQRKNYELNCVLNNVGSDFILYDAIWIDSEHFLMKISDRTSKILSKQIVNPKRSSRVREVSTFNASLEFNGWIGKQTLMRVIPQDRGINSYVDKVTVNGQTHLAIFEKASSAQYSRLLTNSSEWGLVDGSPIAYNADENFIYVLTTMRSSLDAHLIAIDLSRYKDNIYSVTGIQRDGKYKAKFSSNGNYVELRYLGPKPPWQKLINMKNVHMYFGSNAYTIKAGTDPIIDEIEPINDYNNTCKELQNSNVPTKFYRTIKVEGDGVPGETLNYIEILPPMFDPEYKYPLLVHAYGGPGSQIVDKSFSIAFEDIVSSTLNAVVIIIDPRGTGGKGWNFMSYATGNIGYWEPRDIIASTSSYISTNEKFIDKQKVAIWGWSYGGFTTLKTLEVDGGNTFKYGMAVAPVTNWMFYDSIYTERYMNLPSADTGYNKYALISNYAKFKASKRFLIMHGTADDNVHLQNLMWLLDKFDLNNVKNYDVHFFPDSDHSIYFHNANPIVYDKLLNWLRSAFDGKFDGHT